MYKEPKNWNWGEDCHLAFFWGDTAWDNKFWHSLEDGNHISPLQVENYANTYYLIKTRKQTKIVNYRIIDKIKEGGVR